MNISTIRLSIFTNLIFCICIFISFESFSQEAEEITFTHEGLTVFGTFNKPDGEGPFSTLILCPGSGPNDRDGTLLMEGSNLECLYPNLLGTTLKPYKQVAEALADSGYAVLRYDKLEFTYPLNLGTISFTKLWLPVESAIDYVKTRSDVDTSRIVIIGHSEGSYLIPYMARTRNDVVGLISLAGPRTPFDSLLTKQIVDFTQICGGDLDDALFLADQIQTYYTLIRSGSFTESTPPLFGVPAEVWFDYIEVIDSVAINYNLAELPSLFLGFSEDINVPLDELFRLQNDISVTADFWVIPELNHYMTPVDDPSVSQAVTDTIVHWLRQFFILSSNSDELHDNIVINAYPNPFIDNLFIEIGTNFYGTFRVCLRDILGRKLFSMDGYTVNQGRLRIENVETLTSGIYILEIDNGIVRRKVRVFKQ